MLLQGSICRAVTLFGFNLTSLHWHKQMRCAADYPLRTPQYLDLCVVHIKHKLKEKHGQCSSRELWETRTMIAEPAAMRSPLH